MVLIKIQSVKLCSYYFEIQKRPDCFSIPFWIEKYTIINLWYKKNFIPFSFLSINFGFIPFYTILTHLIFTAFFLYFFGNKTTYILKHLIFTAFFLYFFGNKITYIFKYLIFTAFFIHFFIKKCYSFHNELLISLHFFIYLSPQLNTSN